MRSKKLTTYSRMIARVIILIAIANVLLICLILIIIRPSLNNKLAQGYLDSLGSYVKQDVRYTLMVQDTIATQEYVDSIKQFPWIQGVRILDEKQSVIYTDGFVTWTPSIDDYKNRIHMFGKLSAMCILKLIQPILPSQ